MYVFISLAAKCIPERQRLLRDVQRNDKAIRHADGESESSAGHAHSNHLADQGSDEAEYETKLLLTRDGITNERVARLFTSELQAIADEEERAARWAEIKADPENAIFFPSTDQAPTGKPTAPTPPGTAAAGRGNIGAEWSKINQIINGRPGSVNPDEMSRALAMVRQYVEQHGTPPPGVVMAS